MQNTACLTCNKPKANLQCGICHSSICKSCTQFLDEDSFSFLGNIPEQLSHTSYCAPCFDQIVAPELQIYAETMEKAKEVSVYNKTQGKETRLIKRLEEPVHVDECDDYEETILRLAFFAAKANYNSLIDMDIVSTKVKIGTYTSTKFSGTGIPAHVSPDKLVKDRSTWQNPN